MSEIDITPANIIRAVQTKRMQLLNDDISDIDKDRLMLMRDLSKSAVDELKLSVDGDGVKAQRELAISLAKLVTKSSNNPFISDVPVSREVMVDEDNLPDIEPVDGETDTTLCTLTYNELYSEE
mgnify:CR=1 FL=1